MRGTWLELVRSFGIDVISSADLVQLLRRRGGHLKLTLRI